MNNVQERIWTTTRLTINGCRWHRDRRWDGRYDVGGGMRLRKPIVVMLSLVMVLTIASGTVAAAPAEDGDIIRPGGGSGPEPIGACQSTPYSVKLAFGQNNGDGYVTAVVSWDPGSLPGDWDKAHRQASSCMRDVKNFVENVYGVNVDYSVPRLTGELLAHAAGAPFEDEISDLLGFFNQEWNHDANPANIELTSNAPTSSWP